MKDKDKTREQLIKELVEMRRQITKLEKSEIKHKQAEEGLKQSEEKYRILIDSIQDGVFIIQNGKMKFVNEAFARMVGHSVEEVIGIDFRLLVAPEDRKMVADRYRRRQAGEDVPREYEFRMLHKDGVTRVIVNMNVGLVIYRGKTASMGTVKDITERKITEEKLKKKAKQLISSQKELRKFLTESEESRKALFSILEDTTETQNALQKSEKRFRDIVVNTGDWIWETDEKGCYTYCSPVVKQVLGYEYIEVLGKYFYDFFHPDEREELKKAAFEVFEKKETFMNFINQNVHKNGHTVILETSGIPMLDDKGNLLGYRGVDRNVTERVLMNKTLKESLHQSELLLDLMSHDLTNMNQMTLSSLELIMRDKDLSERTLKYSKLAQDQIYRSERLISNVKKLIVLRKEKPHLERVDIEPVLESAISHLGEDFSKRDIEVNFKPQKKKWFVSADELLFDLFYNILHNAVKFDRHEKVIVDVNVSSDDDFWRVELRDRGPGIGDERKETIFLRAWWKGKVVYGLGLGLALVRGIVERYEGRIWVEDRVKGKTEEGSNFVVLLPKAIDD